MVECAECSAVHLRYTLFCDRCGVALVTAPPGVEQHAPPRSRQLFIVRESRREIELPELDAMLVGRAHPSDEQAPEIDLNPDDAAAKGVSRRHARLSRRGEVLYIEDLESTNGTFVNNRRLPPRERVALRANDRVRLGLLDLIYRQTTS